jgi:hypothetical protein
MTTSLKLLPLCTLVLSLALSGSSSTQAAAFSTNAFADAFVTPGPSGNFSGNNFGAAGGLGVSAPGAAKGEFQSVLQFDLAGARNAFNTQFGPGQWSVQTIVLQLTAAPNNNAMFNTPAAGLFQIFWMQNDSWTEGNGTPNTPGTSGITFSSLPTFTSSGEESLGTFSFGGSTSGAVNYNLDVSAGLTADILAGNDVSLRMVAADTSVSYLFNSRNFGTASSRPLFTITAVPEPGVIALSGLALALLIARTVVGRRRMP